jgi:hypothetical protein
MPTFFVLRAGQTDDFMKTVRPRTCRHPPHCRGMDVSSSRGRWVRQCYGVRCADGGACVNGSVRARLWKIEERSGRYGLWRPCRPRSASCRSLQPSGFPFQTTCGSIGCGSAALMRRRRMSGRGGKLAASCVLVSCPILLRSPLFASGGLDFKAVCTWWRVRTPSDSSPQQESEKSD